MSEIYEGIKFTNHKISETLSTDLRIENLKNWCTIFHEKNLAPPYPEGSAGNLSFRLQADKINFIITGSRIGLKNELNASHFVEVVNCEPDKQIVYSKGIRQPSSESMLHYAIYKVRNEVNAIFHGHSPVLLEKAEKLKLPQTKAVAAYGTKELVESVLEILENHNFIILRNHGFFALAKTIEEAGEISLKMLCEAQKL